MVALTNTVSESVLQKDTLNINLEHLLGIEGLDLESMEVAITSYSHICCNSTVPFQGRLKADLLASARDKGGKFSYYAQNAKMENELRELTIENGTDRRCVFPSDHTR